MGVGSFGAAGTLSPGLGDSLPDDVFMQRPTSAEVDGGAAGTLVLFTVGPQHQDCRTWAGISPDGTDGEARD